VVAFLGSVLRGVQVVPIDFRSFAQLVERIQREVQSRLLVHGDSLNPESGGLESLTFDSVAGIEPRDSVSVVDVVPDDVIEIVYTSRLGNLKGLFTDTEISVPTWIRFCMRSTNTRAMLVRSSRFAF